MENWKYHRDKWHLKCLTIEHIHLHIYLSNGNACVKPIVNIVLKKKHTTMENELNKFTRDYCESIEMEGEPSEKKKNNHLTQRV